MKNTTRGLLSLAATCLTVPAYSQALAREYNLEIERQPISVALTEFSKQTGLQVGYFPEALTENIYIGPLSGRYTAGVAIAQLLRPSGLSFEPLNERTIVVTGLESAKLHHREFSTIEQKTAHGMMPAFVRLANIRLAEEPTAEGGGDQQLRTAANGGESDKKRLRGALEEIVVTAQKRQERLQDVPISISVLSGADLDSSADANLTEMLGRVPGVSLDTVGVGGSSMVGIRGVGVSDPLFQGGAASAYYLDTVPFGFVKAALVPDAGAYDLDRVEVLRGPQGTLYGASALNGVVRVLTKDANLDAFEFKARSSLSSTKFGGENYRGDMAVNVPIIEGKLAARAVVGYQNWNGWIDRPNNLKGYQKDANDSELRNMRLKINAQPTERLSIGLSAWRTRDDLGQPPTGEESGRNSSINDEPASSDYDVYGLKVNYELPWFSLASNTSYLDFTHHLMWDLTPFGLVPTPEAPGLGDEPIRFDAHTFAQEVVLNSVRGDSWRWSFGSMYRDSTDRVHDEYVDLFPAPAIDRNQSQSYAVFGELTRLFWNGRWEFTAGLRYFEDDLTLTEESRLTGAPPEELVHKNSTFSDTSKRFVLTWHPTEQATVYGSYGEGFRSGMDQYSTLVLAAPDVPPAEPDSLKNYEVGAKGSLFGGRVSFDTALYYIDWQDPQRALIFSYRGIPFPGFVNTVSASGLGVDLGLTVRPVDALELNANFSWNDLAYDEDQILLPDLIGGQKGDRLINSPEYTAGASASYLFPLGRNGFEGRFSIAGNYTSEKVGQCYVGRPCFPTDDILIARANFSIRAPHHWTATVFVDNLNNEDAVLSGSSAPELSLTKHNIRPRPRTFGVQFEYEFGR